MYTKIEVKRIEDSGIIANCAQKRINLLVKNIDFVKCDDEKSLISLKHSVKTNLCYENGN